MTRVRFPHTLTLLVGCILLAAALTYVVPAGEFQRHEDPATGRSVVVSGTYARVEARPVGPFDALIAIPKGIADAASVIALVFLIGAAFAVIERVGTLARVVGWLVGRLSRRRTLVIPFAAVFFSLGGIFEQTQEELIAFVPALLLLSRSLGYSPLAMIAMSLGTATVGASFSPVNPFQVLIAQRVAQLPPGSGLLFRIAFLVPAVILWIWGTSRYANRHRSEPTEAAPLKQTRLSWQDLTILISIVLALAVYVYGAQHLDWEFDQLSAMFFGIGILAGILGRLGPNGTAEAFVEGFRSMAFASLVIGFARAIYVVLSEGRIVDTLINGLFTPIAGLPSTLSAIGMMLAHVAVHFPVPSASGHAVLTMPLLVPLSDLIGLSRQVTVLAYQYGAGLSDLVIPTNGALMAMLAAAGVRYEEWLRFAIPLLAMLIGLGAVAIVTGVLIGIR